MILKSIVAYGIGVAFLSLNGAAFASTGISNLAIQPNPEQELVEGFFAAGSADLSSPAGRESYRSQIQSLVTNYAAHHTSDPSVAAKNLQSAFATLGIPEQEISQIQALNSQYRDRLLTEKTPAQIQAFWQQYGHDLASSLQAMPYPQGEEFSACQWSVALMAGGLAVGIPLFAYTVGEAMGDRNVSPWIGNTGGLAMILGLGSLIATIPTCLF